MLKKIKGSSDNQKLYIEKGQITQLPKEKKKTKGQVQIYKSLLRAKVCATLATLKSGVS
jgi:hypothetical protein